MKKKINKLVCLYSLLFLNKLNYINSNTKFVRASYVLVFKKPYFVNLSGHVSLRTNRRVLINKSISIQCVLKKHTFQISLPINSPAVKIFS